VKTLELEVADLPLMIRLKLQDQTKDYVLLKTKQDRLLLNKRIQVVDAKIDRQQ
jgi:hypothetical protein